MAASAGAIRAGRAFVELFADDKKLIAQLGRTSAKFKAWGSSLRGIGGASMGIGTAIGAPLALATKTFATYEQALAGLRAAANPTAAEFEKIKTAIDGLSKSSGESPTDIATAFGELLKAGMSVEQVLGGAGEAAIKFAKVGGLQVADAAVVMSDAMNVFAKQGLSAQQAVDALGKTADASSVSVSDITQAFAQASAVFGSAGMSMEELTSAIGILGSAGMKGSDAGTSLKTLLQSLRAPSTEGAKAIKQLGINVRDAQGNLLPMRDIIGELQSKMGGLDPEKLDEVMKDIFGSDAIRAGSILLAKGTAGWDEFQKKLEGSLPVMKKFSIICDTVEGAIGTLKSGFERLQIAIGEALAGPLRGFATILGKTIEWVTTFVGQNKVLVLGLGAVSAALVAGGGALVGLGFASTFVAAGIAGLATVLGALASPVVLVTAGVVGLGVAMAGLTAYFLTATETGQATLKWLGEKFKELGDDAIFAKDGIMEALSEGDIREAADILWMTLRIAWQRGVVGLLRVILPLRTGVVNFFNDTWAGVLSLSENAWSALSMGVISVTKVFQQAWSSAILFVKSVWVDFQRIVNNGLIDANVAAGRFSEEMGAKLKKTLQEGAASGQVAIAQEAARKIAEIEQKAHAEREAEATRHRDRMKAIVEANQGRKSAASEQAEKDLAAAEAELAALLAIREQLFGSGRVPALKAKTPVFGKGVASADSVAKTAANGTKRAVEQFASRGTFSAVGATLLGGKQGTGEKLLAETKKTNTILIQANKLWQRMERERKGLTFG